jgi:hypothetical protein
VGPVDIGVPTSFPQGSQRKLEALSHTVGQARPAGGPGIHTSSLGTVTKGVYTVPEGRPRDMAPPDPTRWAPIAGNPTGGPPGDAFVNRAVRASAERVKFAGQPPVPGAGVAAVLKGGSTPHGVSHGATHGVAAANHGVLRGGAASLTKQDWRTWLDAQDGPAPGSSPMAKASGAGLAGGAVWKMDPARKAVSVAATVGSGAPVKRKRASPGPDSSTARRAAKIRELCKSQGMTVPQASSYIKTHNIKW